MLFKRYIYATIDGVLYRNKPSGTQTVRLGKNELANYLNTACGVHAWGRWDGYYDWTAAGKQTLELYAKDSHEFKAQLAKFLKEQPDLFGTTFHLVKYHDTLEANKLLRLLNFEYIETVGRETV